MKNPDDAIAVMFGWDADAGPLARDTAGRIIASWLSMPGTGCTVICPVEAQDDIKGFIPLCP